MAMTYIGKKYHSETKVTKAQIIKEHNKLVDDINEMARKNEEYKQMEAYLEKKKKELKEEITELEQEKDEYHKKYHDSKRQVLSLINDIRNYEAVVSRLNSVQKNFRNNH